MTHHNSTRRNRLALLLCVPLALAYVCDASVLASPNGSANAAPIDFHNARLQAATANLAQLAGHPIVIRVDPGLLPALKTSLENELTLAIDSLTQGLTGLRQYQPDIFAEGIPRLQRIEYILDAKALYPTGTLDLREPVLRVVLPPGTTTLVQYRLASDSFHEAMLLRRESLYAQRSPDSVAPAEHLVYFQYLTSYHRQQLDSNVDTIEYLNGKYDLDSIIKLVRLYQLSRDVALRPRIQQWLVEAEAKLVDMAKDHADAVENSPPASLPRQAMQAWVAWFYANAGAFDERQYDSLVRLMFREQRAGGKSARHVTIRGTIPGLDPLQFGIDLMGELSPTAAQGQSALRSPRGHVADWLLCPHQRWEQRRSCGEEFYRYALSVADGRSRLVQALLAIQQDPVTEMVTLNIASVGQDDDVIGIIRALEGNERQWVAAVRTLALNEVRIRRPEVLLDEFVRVWRLFPAPARRGAVLYALSEIKFSTYGIAERDEHLERFTRVSAGEYAAFLDQGFRAMSSQERIWKVLSAGWSQAAVIVPKLDAWFDSQNPNLSEQHDRIEVLRGIVNHLCSLATTSDRALLRDYLRGRIKRHPDEVGFQELLDRVISPSCARRTAHKGKPGKSGGKLGAGSLFDD
jgi:hypothetical protein